jgi:hypothetical protein
MVDHAALGFEVGRADLDLPGGGLIFGAAHGEADRDVAFLVCETKDVPGVLSQDLILADV